MSCDEFLECYEPINNFNLYDVDYDSFLDDVLKNSEEFMIKSKEKSYVKCGDYLKLGEKNIWLQFHYKNFMRCRMVGFFDNNCFKIWSMISTPQKEGLGTRTLEIMNEKFKEIGKNILLCAIEVFPTALDFWKKMKSRNLIHDYEIS